jgi:hypothetical protein
MRLCPIFRLHLLALFLPLFLLPCLPSTSFASPPTTKPTSLAPSTSPSPTSAPKQGRATKEAEEPNELRDLLTKKPFRHDFEIRLHLISEHTGIDSGIAPEFRYRLRYRWWLDLHASVRYAPPSYGDAIRYSLMNYSHVTLPHVRDAAFGAGLLNQHYPGLQKGENLLLFMHHIDTKYFAFDGGLVLRFPLMKADNYQNPFQLPAEYFEIFYIYDFRAKLEFLFPRLGGSIFRVGLGFMNFIDNEIIGSNIGGYRLFTEWIQPGVGRFEIVGGVMSYGFWAFTGFYGRWFLRFSYTYTFEH